MIANGLRKAIDHVALLRGAVKSRPGQHLVHTVRGARAVREPLRFAALQVGPPRVAHYRLRHGGLKVFLRHGTRDVHILNEIFGATAARHSYEPPSAVAQALDANPSPRVLDLGANIGLFGAYVLSRWPRAAIRSFEPDPANLGVLRRVIAANGLEERWSLAEVAVANRTGEMTFAAGLYADSHLLEADEETLAQEKVTAHPITETIGVRMVDIFAEDHDVDLMKMDIEGGEWAILTDARLADLGARILVLEWHTRGCPEPNARASAVGLLRAAGYSGLQEVEYGPENGLLWAWRETAAQPSIAHAAQLAPDLRSQAGQTEDRQAIPAQHTRAVT